jgi:hypothetical protein
MMSEPTALTLTWTPRAAELADASLERSREISASGVRATFAVLLALLAAILLSYRVTVALGTTLILLALVLVFFRLTAPLLRHRWAALIAANPTLAETCEVTFDATGVHQSGDRVTSSRLWSTFTAWSDTSKAVVLAASQSATAYMLVVPHRAAASGEELTRLRHLVESHLGPAQGRPGRASRGWLTWAARVVVVACLVVPVGSAMARVHHESGEWSPWPSEAPPRVTREGVTYVRDGGPTGRPVDAVGIDYTPGGGLVLIRWPPVSPRPAAELWVLDHEGVVRHYVGTSGDVAAGL